MKNHEFFLPSRYPYGIFGRLEKNENKTLVLLKIISNMDATFLQYVP